MGESRVTKEADQIPGCTDVRLAVARAKHLRRKKQTGQEGHATEMEERDVDQRARAGPIGMSKAATGLGLFLFVEVSAAASN